MKKSVLSFVLMLLIIALTVVTAVFGINAIGLKSAFADDAINKGLDLVGGSSITFKAILDDEDADMSDSLTKVETIFRERLDALNFTEATIARVGEDSIRVDVPGFNNPTEASKQLGATAKLEFKNSKGEVLFEGDMVERAEAAYGQVSEGGASQNYVAMTFTAEGQKLFAAATAQAATLKSTEENYIDIFLDGQNISHAFVEREINDRNCVITGGFTQDQAIDLASLIDSGNLPCTLEEIELRHVGATLGSNALSTSIKAAAIGIALVMLFMILVYRLPGLVSAVALVGYTALTIVLLVYFRVNLSLPGIAGIILTIGMAVDANVIIYERIKEELNKGVTVRSAVKAGYKGATTAIVDSNVTTLIAAVVLMIFGTGAVYGFAITLLIGTLISMLTSLVASRVLLTSLADFGVGSWIMGKKKSAKAED